jgi:hypothetical protein
MPLPVEFENYKQNAKRQGCDENPCKIRLSLRAVIVNNFFRLFAQDTSKPALLAQKSHQNQQKTVKTPVKNGFPRARE